MLNINETDVWRRLAESDKPTVLYGMGDGAEKIISVLKDYGVAAADVFASDEFVRGQTFLGHRVMNYGEICRKYDDFNIVLAFATRRPDVISKIRKMNTSHTVYAPDVPVAGGGLFTLKYFEENRDKFELVHSCLADEESKNTYQNIINFKISGKIEYLFSNAAFAKDDIYRNLLKLGNEEIIVDMGAYDGDTISEFISYTNGKFAHIYALEPDEKNYKKLVRNTKGMDHISLYCLGAWHKKDTLIFSKKAGRNSKLSAQGVPVRVTDIDSLIDGKCTLLKMDIEGAELHALEGCRNTIEKYAPKLYVCAYHRNEDLFALPLKILEYNSNYRIYFRHSPYIPAWESNFYCTI